MGSNEKTWEYLSDLDAFSLYHKAREQASSLSSDGELSLLPAFRHALAGGIGSAVSNVAVYPLDLIVTRLQVQRRSNGSSSSSSSSSSPQYSGVRDAVSKICRNEGGLAAFYAGVSSDTFKSGADSFFFFLAYNVLWRLRKRYAFSKIQFIQMLDEIALGMVAGALTKALTTPIQIVVTHKQTQAMSSSESISDNGSKALSAREILADIYRKQGLAGLWSGYSASIVLTLNPSITFSVDSLLQRLLRVGEKPSAFLTFILAATGKATASTIMYPVSLAKSRAQASQARKDENGNENADEEKAGKGKKSKPSTANVLLTIPEMARKDGIASLYAGIWGEVLKGFFSHGLTMMVKQRVYSLVIRLVLAITALLKGQRLVSVAKHAD